MRKSVNLEFGVQVSKIFSDMLREVSRYQAGIMKKGWNLPVSHIVVLEALRDEGPCAMGRLSNMLNLTMSAVTGIIDKMIKLGLVERERRVNDRRVVTVVLMPKGAQAAEEITAARKIFADNIFSVLDEPEKTEYLRLVTKVYKRLKEENEK
ncbi:MAG: MarR family transcriptional regulator [Candidatus Omnitrophota bacterium]